MSRNNLIPMVLLAALIAVVGMGVAPGPASAAQDPIERLIQDAASASVAKRLQAVDALGQSGDLRALQPLLNLLDDVNPSVREQAMQALQTLAKRLRQIYSHLAQWIDSLLLQFDIYLAPDPPVERTRLQRAI